MRKPSSEDAARIAPVIRTLREWYVGTIPEGLFTCKPWEMAALLLSETRDCEATIKDLSLLPVVADKELKLFRERYHVDLAYGCIMVGVIRVQEVFLEALAEETDATEAATLIRQNVATLSSFADMIMLGLGSPVKPTSVH